MNQIGYILLGAGIGAVVVRFAFKQAERKGGVELVKTKIDCQRCDLIALGILITGFVMTQIKQK